jgi:formamidopyrimidine-DNA glycosylase
MPELPEVEIVTRNLRDLIVGRTILRAKLIRPLLAPNSSPTQFSQWLRGSRIEYVGRRGKHILLMLDNGRVLITHLRMSGRFLLLSSKNTLPKHTHATFELDDGRVLAFADQRHFGLMKIVKAEALFEAKELRHLAPEPFSEDFSVEYLSAILRKSRRTIKETLLDQTRVTGLGNIYVAEALFRARIHPSKTSATLSRKRAVLLHTSIREVLREALDRISGMNIDMENIDGSYFSGTNDERWIVYDREGEPCSECGSLIRRIRHAGRSTYYCPQCQRR